MKVKFAISSHKNFYETTYPIIVNSLINSGVPKEDIYFFIGGFSSYDQQPNNEEINIYTTDHNSIDFTGLISVVDLNLKADYWFLLHDTCYVGDRFYDIVSNYNYENVDAVKMCNDVSMNMGSYKQSYLDDIKEELLKYKNTNYSQESLQHYKSLLVQKEDLFFHKTKNKKEYNSTLRLTEGPLDFYKNGIPRIIEYFEQMDLYKVKANWYPKPTYELNL